MVAHNERLTLGVESRWWLTLTGTTPDTSEHVRLLNYARWNPEARHWVIPATAENIVALSDWHSRGLLGVHPTQLLAEEPGKGGQAMVAGRDGVFQVSLAQRNQVLYDRVSSLPGARWDARSRSVTVPAHQAGALSDLVDAGLLCDPFHLFTGGVRVLFDTRDGQFKVRGNARAAEAFHRKFPATDVLASWRAAQTSAKVTDPFTKEVYDSELARHTGSIPQPEGLQLELHPHQLVGYFTAQRRTGFAIFDDMGLGKTPVGIAWGLSQFADGLPRVVVVCPASLRSQWEREILRFTGDDDITLITGPANRRQSLIQAANTSHWVVLSYETLTSDVDDLKPLLTGSGIIFDEAHRVRNSRTERSKAAYKTSWWTRRRLALTGTPLDNNPAEMHAIFSRLLNPWLLGDLEAFQGRYMIPGAFGGWVGSKNLDELSLRLKPHYSRFRHSDVESQLPVLRVQNLILDPDTDLSEALTRAHDTAAGSITMNLMDTWTDHSDTFFWDSTLAADAQATAEMTAVGALRMACSSPRLLHRSEAPAAKAIIRSSSLPDVDGPKVEYVVDLAGWKKLHGDRLVVFSTYLAMLELLAERLDKEGITYVKFHGGMTQAARDAAVQAFTTPGEGGPVVFLSTDAGAEGLNLGRCCHTLVSVDLAYTPGRQRQRAKRIDRIDNTHGGGLVVNLTLRDTIEEGLLAMLTRKADDAGYALGEDSQRSEATGRRPAAPANTPELPLWE